MTASDVVLRPKALVVVASALALIAAPLVVFNLPNPFEGLGVGGRPPRFIAFLWVAMLLISMAATWRLLSWTSYRADKDGLTIRTLSGVRHIPWSELESAEFETPVGVPPAYELRFKKRKVRILAAIYHRPAIKALSALAKTL